MFRIRALTIRAHDRTPPDAPLSRRLDRVFQGAQALDLDLHAVAWLHEDRRLARITDAGRLALSAAQLAVLPTYVRLLHNSG